MPKKEIIPASVVSEIESRVENFNKNYMAKKNSMYVFQIKGKFIYLMRTNDDDESLENICRLTYRGDLENTEFAIYKFSTEKYDPNEWGFPGERLVDGSLEGAMKAGLKAYP